MNVKDENNSAFGIEQELRWCRKWAEQHKLGSFSASVFSSLLTTYSAIWIWILSSINKLYPNEQVLIETRSGYELQIKVNYGLRS